jgi:hypothetical protein
MRWGAIKLLFDNLSPYSGIFASKSFKVKDFEGDLKIALLFSIFCRARGEGGGDTKQ